MEIEEDQILDQLNATNVDVQDILHVTVLQIDKDMMAAEVEET